MWLYWENFLKNHHLPLNSTAVVGSITRKWLMQLSFWTQDDHVQHWAPMLVQRSQCFSWTLFQYQSPMLLLQCSHNVARMLWQCWCPTLKSVIVTITQIHYLCITVHCIDELKWIVSNQTKSNVHTMLVQHRYEVWQCYNNIVTTLGFSSKYNLGITFTRFCLDVHTTLLGCIKLSTMNVDTTLGLTFPEHLPHCGENFRSLGGLWLWLSWWKNVCNYKMTQLKRM